MYSWQVNSTCHKAQGRGWNLHYTVRKCQSLPSLLLECISFPGIISHYNSIFSVQKIKPLGLRLMWTFLQPLCGNCGRVLWKSFTPTMPLNCKERLVKASTTVTNNTKLSSSPTLSVKFHECGKNYNHKEFFQEETSLPLLFVCRPRGMGEHVNWGLIITVSNGEWKQSPQETRDRVSRCKWKCFPR